MRLSKNGLKVLRSRYLRKDASDNALESPEALFIRVSQAIASAEKPYFPNRVSYWEKRFYKVLSSLDFLPNSPTLMNAGLPLGQLSACYVLPVEDSLDSIFTTLRHAALIQQSGGGTGFNFSALRPRGDHIAQTGGTSSGPLSFMKIFDATTEEIHEGGKRRGANMGILNIDHPDVEAFIKLKVENHNLRNFNISVAVSDDFMRAVEDNRDWHLLNPRTGLPVKKLPAQNLWKEIIHSAWLSGDPGLLFLDTINRSNPTPALGPIMCTNPCGEVPLLPYESCNLGSINLEHMLRREGGHVEIDWQKLEHTVETGIRFLDDVIDVNKYPQGPFHKMAHDNRKIGLGVMGWAHMLILLEIPYDSHEAIALGEKVMHFIQVKSHAASRQLAEERGPFPNWPQSIYYPGTPMRHATCTAIAPTGTLSIIANTSASIEPVFALSFRREHILEGEVMEERNPLYAGLKKKHPKDVQHLARIFPTSLDIPYTWHIQHLLAFQKFTDNAVSKTINMESRVDEADVGKALLQAWKRGAKGITIFRYGSKGEQVLHKGHIRDQMIRADLSKR